MNKWTVTTLALCVIVPLAFFYKESVAAPEVTVETACPIGVTLSWIGSAQIGFNVYRTSSSNQKQFIGSVTTGSVNGNKFTDNTISATHIYIYWVEAVNNTTTSIIGYEAAVVPYALTAPSPPITTLVAGGIDVLWTYHLRFFSGDSYNLEAATVLENFKQANGNISGSGVFQQQFQNLTGELNTHSPAGSIGINIGRSTDLGQYNLVKTISDTSVSRWLDSEIQPNHSYSYVISPFYTCGYYTSGASNTITVPVQGVKREKLEKSVLKLPAIYSEIYNIRGQKVWSGFAGEGSFPAMKLALGMHMLVQGEKNIFFRVLYK